MWYTGKSALFVKKKLPAPAADAGVDAVVTATLDVTSRHHMLMSWESMDCTAAECASRSTDGAGRFDYLPHGSVRRLVDYWVT